MPRAVVLALDRVVAVWIDEELENAVRFEHATSVATASEILRRSPQPQILIVDFDALDGTDTLELHSVRDGWFGSIISLGDVTPELRQSLGIEHVVAPFERGALRTTIRDLGLNKPTARMTHQKK
jgi:hypothetical protein